MSQWKQNIKKPFVIWIILGFVLYCSVLAGEIARGEFELLSIETLLLAYFIGLVIQFVFRRNN